MRCLDLGPWINLVNADFDWARALVASDKGKKLFLKARNQIRLVSGFLGAETGSLDVEPPSKDRKQVDGGNNVAADDPYNDHPAIDRQRCNILGPVALPDKIYDYVYTLVIGGLFNCLDKVCGSIVGGVSGAIAHVENHVKLVGAGSRPGDCARAMKAG